MSSIPLLAERAARRLEFAAAAPLAFDLSWPFQTPLSEFRGLGAIRVHTAESVLARIRIQAETETTVCPAEDSKIALTVRLAPGAQAAIEADAAILPPDADGPLLAALLGGHPLNWVRMLLHGVGSPIWPELAREIGVSPEQLGRIAAQWRQLTAGEEAELWRSETLPEALQADLDGEVLASLRRCAEQGRFADRLCPSMLEAMALRRRHEEALRELSRKIYAEAQAVAGARITERAARLLDPAARQWPLAGAVFDLSVPAAVWQFQRALAGDTAAFQAGAGVSPAESMLTRIGVEPVAVEVSCPLMARRKAPRLLGALPEARVRCSAGRVEVEIEDSSEPRVKRSAVPVLERMLLAPFHAEGREPGCSGLSLSAEIRFPLGDQPPLWPVRALMEWLGVPAPACPWPPSAATIGIAIPAGWAEIWHALPHSRDDSFGAVFSSIAWSVHQAMRRWIPFLALNTLEPYSEPSFAMPLLAYAASEPGELDGKERLRHPAPPAAAIRRALDSAAPRFPAILERVHAGLLAAGHRSVRSYNPPRAAAYLNNVYRQRAGIARLMAADSFIVEEILHLADLAAELRGEAASPKAAARIYFQAVESARLAIARCYRKIFNRPCFEPLPAILWIEATAAACRAMGSKAQVAASAAFHSQGWTVSAFTRPLFAGQPVSSPEKPEIVLGVVHRRDDPAGELRTE